MNVRGRELWQIISMLENLDRAWKRRRRRRLSFILRVGMAESWL